MKKVSNILVVAVFLLIGFSMIQPMLSAAEGDKDAAAQAVPQVKIEPAVPTAPAPAAPSAAVEKVVDDANVAPAAETEDVDDVAVLKQAADELAKAGKADLAKKVRDIAEGLDW